MSDVMLLGVLGMPRPDDPTQLSVLDWIQLKGRIEEARQRIVADEETIAALQAELAAAREQSAKWLAFARDLPDGELDWKARAEAADARVKELEATFDLRWKADERAINRWREANPGSELIWPDHADLCVWLLEGYGEIGIELMVAEARAERLRLAAEKAVEAMENAANDMETVSISAGYPHRIRTRYVAPLRAARAGLMEAMENGG